MGFFASKQEQLLRSLVDEQIYELVAFELAHDEVRPGLWMKALAESGGDENAASAAYVRLRAQQLRLGVDITEKMLAHAELYLFKPMPHKAQRPPEQLAGPPTPTPAKAKTFQEQVTAIYSHGAKCQFCQGFNIRPAAKSDEQHYCVSCNRNLLASDLRYVD